VSPSLADAMNHQNSVYKFKSTNGMVSGNNHLPGGVVGVGSYRHQRSGPHPFQQQQPLNLSQVRGKPNICRHMLGGRRVDRWSGEVDCLWNNIRLFFGRPRPEKSFAGERTQCGFGLVTESFISYDQRGLHGDGGILSK